jgi:hypothetical protein
MKLDDYMRYPHPVLSSNSGDYTTGDFRCSFEQNITRDSELRIVSELQIDNPQIAELVASQAAAVGYFLVCRRTYFNHLQKTPLGPAERFFDTNRLFGTVTIRPVVWTEQVLENFSSPLLDQEFGSGARIGKGAVIALGPEFRFSMDPKKYKPFESIFEIARNDEIEPNEFSVDHDQDRITILASNDTFNAITAIREIKYGKDILLNAVYLPAIIEVISRLQAGGINVEGRKWYRVFSAKCDELGYNPMSSQISPLLLAQKLLRGPLKKTISAMESF